MARKPHTAEEIVNKLRQAEVELGKGSSVATALRDGVGECDDGLVVARTLAERGCFGLDGRSRTLERGVALR